MRWVKREMALGFLEGRPTATVFTVLAAAATTLAVAPCAPRVAAQHLHNEAIVAKLARLLCSTVRAVRRVHIDGAPQEHGGGVRVETVHALVRVVGVDRRVNSAAPPDRRGLVAVRELQLPADLDPVAGREAHRRD